MTKALNAKQIDFEIKFFNDLLLKNPKFTQAIAALAELYTSIGDYQNGLVMDLRLSQLRPQDAVVLYNLACSYSLLNQIDLSFDTLKDAIGLGYDDFFHLTNDRDLHNLKQDQRFIKWMSSIKNRMYA